MPDRENIIKAFETRIISDSEEFDTVEIPVGEAVQILELLKKQEAVEPIAKKDGTYECICGAIVGWDELDASGIVQTRFNYCPYCGKAVKWDA